MASSPASAKPAATNICAEGADRDQGQVGSRDTAVLQEGYVRESGPSPPLPGQERAQQHDCGSEEQSRLVTCRVSRARATANTSRATSAVTVMTPGTSSCPLLLGRSDGSSQNEAIRLPSFTDCRRGPTRLALLKSERPGWPFERVQR